jgi:hypothetical protein
MGHKFFCRQCQIDLIETEQDSYRILHIDADGELFDKSDESRFYLCSLRCMANWLAGELAKEESK